MVFRFLQSNGWIIERQTVEADYLLMERRKNFITLLYGNVDLPGWPSGSGGGLQTHYTWVRFPLPAPMCQRGKALWLIITEVGGTMTEKAVEETFVALFALTDLRQIFRETKPTHQFDSEQKRQIKKMIEKVRQSLDIIEKELIK